VALLPLDLAKGGPTLLEYLAELLNEGFPIMDLDVVDEILIRAVPSFANQEGAVG
jgi:hypothetical protein